MREFSPLGVNHPYDFGEGPLRFLVETPLPLDGDRQMLAARKVLLFRLATDPKARFGGVLQLRIENLHPGDELHIELNGELILRSSVIGNQGQFAGPHDQCRCPYDQPRLDELCHFIYEFDLSDIPVIQGENELSFQILRGQLPRHHAIVSQVDVILALLRHRSSLGVIPARQLVTPTGSTGRGVWK